MADSIEDFDLIQGSQFALDALLTKLAPIAAFTVDVVDEDGTLRTVNASQVRKGKSIDVRLFNAPVGEAGAGTGDFNKSSNNYEDATDLNVDTVNVALDKHKKSTFSMDDAQLELWQDGLPKKLIELHAFDLGEIVSADIMSIITIANFSATSIVAAAAMDFDEVAAGRQIAVDAGWDMNNLFSILDSAYYLSLLQDDTTQTLISRQTDQLLRDANIGKLHTVNIAEATNIPLNSQVLHGFITDGTAIAIAGAALIPGRGSSTASLVIEHELATDPITGLTMGMRKHYDAATGEVFVTMEMVYGRSVGRASALHRYTTA